MGAQYPVPANASPRTTHSKQRTISGAGVIWSPLRMLTRVSMAVLVVMLEQVGGKEVLLHNALQAQ